MVVCYTNHALDDILEGLLDIGIPPDTMLRLGGKSTAKTEPLLIQNQPNNRDRTQDQWDIVKKYRKEVEVLYRSLENAFNGYLSFKASLLGILAYLEFEVPDFYGAFEVPDPEDSDGMIMVGRGGEKVSATYLLSQWQRGRDAGIYESDIRFKSETINKIWDMTYDTRLEHFQRWEDALMQESIEKLVSVAKEYNECLENLMRAQNTSLQGILHSKRIVGCTTTAAAKYSDDIRTFNPDVLLVEEAGEILESHVLTSLGPETSQMILIGDHK